MNHLRELRISSLLKWVSVNYTHNSFRPSRTKLWAIGSTDIAQNYRFYRTKKSLEEKSQFSPTVRRQAQAALLEYLHSTRGLQFLDAEHISRNSPHFLESLLKRVDNSESQSVGSVARYLRYHPINEFEPFFESMGLHPSEYSLVLPPQLMFLNDDQVLMQNYHVFCNCGFPRDKIGKIYKEAPEVFRYSRGVLELKLRLFGEVGLELDRSTLVKVIYSNPYLLVGNVDREFLRFLEKLRSAGIEHEWIWKQLLKGVSYNWSRLFEVLLLFGKLGFGEEQLGKVIGNNPELLFESSGRTIFSIMGFLWKFGCTQHKIYSMFAQFPQIQTGKFLKNLHYCYHVLIEIEMPVEEIGSIFRTDPLLLGSCSLKKADSLLRTLNSGKKRLCKMILEDPQVLKKWVLGARVEPVPIAEEMQRSKEMKTKFLLNLGFVENRGEMEGALKAFRGKGLELQERFDCFVKAGIDPKDVSTMIRVYPNILNQTKDVIEAKIDFLVNSLGYPLSSLVSFPSYIAYNLQRTKLRVSMYNWLKNQGSVDPNLALRTIVACSEKAFVRAYVSRHPEGHEIWEKLKKDINPSD
ncbi:transcription termination factor MTEF18, mitochondrial-like [Ipomoea triloba]|uniref:transcription termination factor MTEF18, mitochondrial-like n=1 Tax=Ipomoea triloba TaxID=35885 RepID=UPI00125D09E9|nr:transcription termination factor MTEF18, mitochondrial-like [Ipomoea triloba]